MSELPKLSKEGAAMSLYELLPDSDVYGYCLEWNGVYSIGVIEVPKERRNQGRLTAFLKRLDPRVGFPTVMSPHLARALAKADFVFGKVNIEIEPGIRDDVEFFFRMEAWKILGAVEAEP